MQIFEIAQHMRTYPLEHTKLNSLPACHALYDLQMYWGHDSIKGADAIAAVPAAVSQRRLRHRAAAAPPPGASASLARG